MATAPVEPAEPVEPAAPPVAAEPIITAPAGGAPAPAVDPGAEPPTPANDDWRVRIAGEDAKLLGYLGRFGSEKALAEAVKKQSDDLKAGKYLTPLPENPTDAEIAAFRKQNGVPDKAEGYLEKLPDGLVVGEDDKAVVNVFLEKMHGLNASPAFTGAALEAYYGIVEEQAVTQAQAEADFKDSNVELLRDEWGADYKRNIAITSNFMATLPADVSKAISGGRDDSGMPLANNAAVVKWLTGLALEANPIATVVPGAGANQASAIADEIAKFDAMMGDRNSEYWKGPNAAANRARYLELTEAKLKLGKA